MVDEQNPRPAGVLNLDELFGASRPIKVVWKGVEYHLRRPEGMGPVEIVRLEHLRERHAALDAAAKTDGVEPYMLQIEECVDEMIAVLSTELARQKLPFLAKTNVLEFWIGEIDAENAAAQASNPSKKGQRRRIGARPSRN